MSTLLTVEGITKRFGGLTAVDNVSFTVGQHEIVGLIGANGAGKTTLFSMIAGQKKPSAGEICLLGRRIDGFLPHKINRLGVARTFQIVRPFRLLTVLENVLVGVNFGASRAPGDTDPSKEAWRILEMVGLQDRAHMPAGALTLAGHKRLEVAKALATRPKLLLLDEVFAGLTPAESDAAIRLVRNVHQESALTIVLVEHVLKVVMQLCQRVVVLNNGKKIAEGTPEVVRNDPHVIDSYLGTQP